MKFLQALILVIVLLECQGLSSSVIKQGTDDAKPGNDAPKPLNDNDKPGNDAPKPVNNNDKPGNDAPKPVNNNDKPGNNAPKPVAPTKTNGSATFFCKQSIFIFALISNVLFFLM
jgi:hypothetical protein